MAFANPFTALFGAQAPAPAAAPAPGTPPAGTPAAGSTVPAFQQSTTEPPKPAALAEYADLFNTAPVPEGGPAPTIDDPYITLDKDAITRTVASMNFAQGVELQDNMQKALQGDMQAFAAVLNSVAQNVYSQTAQMSGIVADRAAREGVTRLQSTIPQIVRSSSTSNSLTNLNPMFDNPAVRPIVDMARQNFETKNPTATPQQITEMVNRYMTDVSSAFAPAPAAPTNKGTQQGGSTDFGGFFGPQ